MRPIHKMIIIGGIGSCFSTNAIARPSTVSPNIILIVVDDMGYSDFGCYGNKINKTPNIDNLAKGGVRFTDFHTNGSVSSPTRAALMTGRYQQYAGIEGVITAANHRNCGLNPETITIADLLKANNYETVMYGKWHLGYQVENNPIHYGFDEFVGYVAGNVDYFSHIDQEGYEDWWHQDKKIKEEGYTTNLITDYALKYLQKKHDKPFFMYLPFEACHGPWQGPNDKAIRHIINGKYKVSEGRKDIKNVYKEMVKSLDENIGRIIEGLKVTGLDENTLILLFSDNGGAHLSNNSPWSGGKGSLLEGGHRVSSIVYWPGVIKSGQVSDETIMTMDILPTLCEVSSTPVKGNLDGISFWKVITKQEKMPERLLFWRYNGKVCVRQGDWKLTLNHKNKNTILVNLSEDISEKNNLASKYPQKVKELTEAILNWEKNFENIKKQS